MTASIVPVGPILPVYILGKHPDFYDILVLATRLVMIKVDNCATVFVGTSQIQE